VVGYLKPSGPALAALIAPQDFLSHVQPPAPQSGAGARAVALAEHPAGETLATLTLPYASPRTGTVRDQNWASIHSSPPWEDTPAPVMVRHAFGQGLALYSAMPLEAVEAEANRRLLAGLFMELLGPRPAFAAAAHPAVWINVQHQPAARRFTVAFLNRQTEDPPLPIPALCFTLRRPENGRFTALWAAPDRAPVAFTLDARGDLHAERRDLERFDMLVAEYGPAET